MAADTQERIAAIPHLSGSSMPDLTPLPPLPDDDALGTVVDAMLPLLGLAAEPGWRGPILQNLRMVSGAARRVLEFPLPDELEPAPRFEP